MSECRPENYASGKQCAGCGRAWGEDGPEECPIEPIADGRWETGMEHAARDMRDGRFPERSERQRVPAPAVPDDVAGLWQDTAGNDDFCALVGLIPLRDTATGEAIMWREKSGDFIDFAAALRDTIEAQAAELVRLRSLIARIGKGHVDGISENDRRMIAALAHPTGEPT